MKIGIVTFHMAHNCGAMLQAYALSKTVGAFPGVTCEIVDYRLPYIYQKYEQLLQMPIVESKRLQFDHYMRHMLPLSQRILSQETQLDYDCILVGSDQIWNERLTGGFQPIYFAKNFPHATRRIAYGASTGEIPRNLSPFRELLSELDDVGVRERYMIPFLAPVYPRKIHLCVDPVLLRSPQEWSEHPCPTPQFPYILCYGFTVEENEYIAMEQWAAKQQCQVLNLVTHQCPQYPTIVSTTDYGPLQWLHYIKSATAVYTDSYHCFLFALLFQKPCHLLTHEKPINGRIADVIERFFLTQNPDGFYVQTTKTQQCLDKEKQSSLLFLQKAIFTPK